MSSESESESESAASASRGGRRGRGCRASRRPPAQGRVLHCGGVRRDAGGCWTRFLRRLIRAGRRARPATADARKQDYCAAGGGAGCERADSGEPPNRPPPRPDEDSPFEPGAGRRQGDGRGDVPLGCARDNHRRACDGVRRRFESAFPDLERQNLSRRRPRRPRRATKGSSASATSLPFLGTTSIPLLGSQATAGSLLTRFLPSRFAR